MMRDALSSIRNPQSKIGRAADAAVLRAVERRVLAGLLRRLQVEFELRDAARGRLELFGIELFRLARELEGPVHASARGVEGAHTQTLVTYGLDYAVARGDEVRLVLAYENHVRAGLDCAQRGLGHGERLHDRAHLHVVRDDESVELEYEPEQSSGDVAADCGGELVEALHSRGVAGAPEPRLQKLRHVGERGVAHHHGAQALARSVKHQVHEGHEGALENFFPSLRDDGQTPVRVNLRAAESGEVFADGDDAARLHPVEVRAREQRDHFRVDSEGARAKAIVLVVAGEIEHGREVHVEAEESQHARRELTELLREFRAPRVAHRLGRRRRLADFAEAVNESALLVNADEDARAGCVAYLSAEERDLLRRFDVAPEEYDAARSDFAQERAPVSVERRDGQTDEKKPPGLSLKRLLCAVHQLFRRHLTHFPPGPGDTPRRPLYRLVRNN